MSTPTYSEDGYPYYNPQRGRRALAPRAENQPVPFDPHARYEWADDEFMLRDLWRIVRRYRWLIGSVFVVAMAGALVLTAVAQPVYRASVIVEVQPNSQLVEFENVVKSRIDERSYLDTQEALLASRNVAQTVINDLELENSLKSNEQEKKRGIGTIYDEVKSIVYSGWATLSGEDASAKNAGAVPREGSQSNPAGASQSLPAAEQQVDEHRDVDYVRRYLDRLSVERVGRANLLKVNLDSFDPQEAAKLAEAHVDAYVKESRERRLNSTSAAKEFLQEQIVEAEANLEESERALNQFARSHNIVDIADHSNVLEEGLESLNHALMETRKERIAAEARYEQATAGDAETLSAILDGGLLMKIREEYIALRSEYRKQSTIFTSEYPGMRQLEARLDAAKTALEAESRNVLNKLNAERLELMSRERQLTNQIEEQRSDLLDLNERTVSFNILRREQEANNQLYGGLLDKLKDISVVNGMELNSVSVVDRVPAKQVHPDTRKHVAFAGALGVFGGIGIAVLLAFMDNTFKTRRELARALGLPFLGLIPKLTSKEIGRKTDLGLLSEADPCSVMADAIRSIRTALFFSGQASPRRLLVTSTTSGEGKSVIASNLALSLARNSNRVLLVETDLRHPTLASRFGIHNTPGLTEYLTGVSTEVVRKTRFSGVSCIPAGKSVEHSTDLLASKQMSDYLDSLASEFDVIILDGMPVMGFADSLILSAGKVDGVVFVVKAGSTHRDAVEESVERLHGVGAKIIGTVLNGIDTDHDEYFYYRSAFSKYQRSEGAQVPVKAG